MSTQTIAKDKVLRMERVIAATPERLFALWTEPEELIKWWGPEGFTTPQHDMDVRPGGRSSSACSPRARRPSAMSPSRSASARRQSRGIFRCWRAPV